MLIALPQVEASRNSLISKYSINKRINLSSASRKNDINRKNIIYSDDRLCLIDFEPSLLQVKDRVKQWMSTRPYRYSEDINNNNITIKSDFLGFGCFVKWFLGSSHPPQFYATRCSEMINQLEINSTPFQTLVPLLVES